MSGAVRVTCEVATSGGHDLATTDHRDLSPAGTGAMGARGAGMSKSLLVGYAPQSATPYQGVYRSYMRFDLTAGLTAAGLTWSDVDIIEDAWVSLYTRESTDGGSYPKDQALFETGSSAKVRIHRLSADAVYGDDGDGLIENTGSVSAAHWDVDDYSDDPSYVTPAKWEGYVTPNKDTESRIKCPGLVGRWAPASAGGHAVRYRENGAIGTGAGEDNEGIILRTPSETAANQEMRAEFHSPRSTNAYRPRLTILVRLWQPAPDAPRIISPKDDVEPDFDFRAILPRQPSDDPVTSVSVEVERVSGSVDLWTVTRLPNTEWEDGECRFDNPGQPTIPAGALSRWRLKANAASPGTLSDWQEFTIVRDRPTTTPDAAGEVSSTEGLVLTAEATVGVGIGRIRSVEVELIPRVDPAVAGVSWRDPIWRGRGLPSDVEPV